MSKPAYYIHNYMYVALRGIGLYWSHECTKLLETHTKVYIGEPNNG